MQYRKPRAIETRRHREALRVAAEALPEFAVVEPEISKWLAVPNTWYLSASTAHERQSRESLAWRELFGSLGRPYDRMIFVASCGPGLAEPAAAALLQAIELHPAGSTLVVATDGGCASNGVPADIRSLSAIDRHLTAEDRKAIIGKLIYYLQPDSAIGIDSDAFRAAVSERGVALSARTNLYGALPDQPLPKSAKRAESSGDKTSTPLADVSPRPTGDARVEPTSPRQAAAGTPTISALITFHKEGLIANASLLSAARAKARAEAEGLSVEIVAVLDNADDQTVQCVSSHTAVDRLVTTSFGDPGLARNRAIEAARGDWIALLDGDDLWCESWLVAAHRMASSDPRPLILHPRANLYFGPDSVVLIHVDMEDEDFDLVNLSIGNYWTIASFGRRDIYASTPFRPRDPARQIAFEDWAWNVETIAEGYLHKCVTDTVHAVRKSPRDSVNRRDVITKAMPHPTALFREMLIARERLTQRADTRDLSQIFSTAWYSSLTRRRIGDRR